jgi:hypothetical protein
MRTTDNGGQHIQLDKRLLMGGAVLVGAAGVLGATGMILAGVAFTSAGRQWVRGLDRPPRETAKVMASRLAAASSAGAKAWRSEATLGR